MAKVKVMKTSYKFIYFLSSMFTYIVFGFIEFFLLNNFLDIISNKYYIHVIVMIVCLIIVNPLLTYSVVGKLPLKPTKRVKGTLNDDLKRQTHWCKID